MFVLFICKKAILISPVRDNQVLSIFMCLSIYLFVSNILFLCGVTDPASWRSPSPDLHASARESGRARSCDASRLEPRLRQRRPATARQGQGVPGGVADANAEQGTVYQDRC